MSLIQQNMGAIYDGSQRLIAPVLNSTTATKNWAVGQEFILDGNLYKVTTAIPSGSQIIVSGSSANCELADTVTEQLNEIRLHYNNVFTTASGTDTYTNKLAEIKPYVASLTQDERRRSLIVFSSGDVFFPNSIATTVSYILTYPSATAIDFYCVEFSSSSNKYIRAHISDSVTFTDLTSQTTSNRLSLMVLKDR